MTKIIIHIPYFRFKAYKSGKYYDEDIFDIALDSELFENKNKLYYELHNTILPQLAEKVGKSDFYVVIPDDKCNYDLIGWPYMYVPKNYLTND